MLIILKFFDLKFLNNPVRRQIANAKKWNINDSLLGRMIYAITNGLNINKSIRKILFDFLIFFNIKKQYSL